MCRRLLVLGVLLVLGFSSAAVLAQETTTGNLEGTVTDPQGGPLPGVTVTITSAQGTKTETTDANGRFRFTFLTTGTYDLTATLQGFNTVKRENLTVSLGSRMRVEIILSPGAAETIEVVGAAPVIDLSTSTTGATISSELMQSVPVGRTFASTLALAPGVVSSGIDESNPSVAGASGLENTYVVDGVNIGNTGYGSAGSYSIIFGSLGTGVNFSYIQEVQVKTGGYEPEFGEALGGYVNLVTKSGGNTFKASGFAFAQSQELESERKKSPRENATFDPIGFDSWDFGFEAGGPVVRDKAFWFAAFDPTFTTRSRETARSLFAPTIPESLRIHHTLDVKRTVYNYAANVKLYATPKHTFSVSAFGDPSIGEEGAQREDALAVTDAKRRFSEIRFGGNNVVGRWTGELIENNFLEASVAYHRDVFEEDLAFNEPNGIDRRPIVNASGDTISTAPRRFGGVGFFEDATSSNTQYRVKFSSFISPSNPSWPFRALNGEHNLRYGLEFQDINYDHTANYSGPGGIEIRTDPTADPISSSSGYIWDINADGTRFRISRIRSGNLTAETKAHYLSFFVSDTWSPVKWINLMAGVRYEEETLLGNLAKFNWENNWAPRLHLRVDPTRDNKSKISLAYGRFFGKVPNDLAVRALSSEVTYILAYDLANVDLSDPNNPRIIGPHRPDPLSFGNVPTIVDPESKLTYQDEYVANVEREVIPSLKLGVSYLHRRLGRTLEDVALVPYSRLVREDSLHLGFGNYFITNPRPDLVPEGGGVGGFPKPSRKYHGVTFKADKRFGDNWQLLSSYTWSRLRGNYEGYFRRDNGQSDPFITSLFDFPYLYHNDPNDPEIDDRRIFKYLIEDGLLPNDRTHVLNLFGSYAFPFDLNVGASLRVQSGTPITRLGFNDAYGNGLEIPLEPRGASGRTPTTADIGLHLDYSFKLGSRNRLALIFDVFNLLDQQKAEEVDQEFELNGTVNPDPTLHIDPCQGCQNPDFGLPSVFQGPRRIRLAARSSF